MDTTLTWKLWTMILMKLSGNWNRRLTKSVPHPSGCLSVGCIEKSVMDDWKKLIGPEKAYMFSCVRWWPCWGLRKRRIRPKCIMGDSCCSITFITNSCVLCPQTDSDNGNIESASLNSPLNCNLLGFFFNLTVYVYSHLHVMYKRCKEWG